MKTLPLFYYPSTWVWVDDDNLLLNTMVDVFSKKNTIKAFSFPKECLAFIQKNKSPLSNYPFIRSNEDDEHYGLLQSNPMEFNVTDIIKLVNIEEKYREITVMLIDNHMPEMDGITLATLLRDNPIQKILLTGNTEDSKAIESFNNNLIQRFIKKGSDNMYADLAQYLETLSVNYFEQQTKPLLTYLETEHKLPLSDPVFIDFFEEHCKKHQIKEYYLMDKQGSYLCVDHKGKHSCLVVHTERSLQRWLDMYSNEKALSEADKNDIKNFKKIPFFGVGKEAFDMHHEADWEKYIFKADMLQGREKYFLVTI